MPSLDDDLLAESDVLAELSENCEYAQMLGRALHDPEAIEGPAGSSAGLGWLDIETTLAAAKQLRNVTGRLAWAAGVVGECAFQAGPDEAGWLISWCPPDR